MSTLIIKNIGILAGLTCEDVLYKRGDDVHSVDKLYDAWLRVDDGHFTAYGPMAEFPVDIASGAEVVDAEGGMVAPSFCDSHTHIVYAGSREGEFVDKINGLSYEEIAANGGGILNSSDLLADISEADLYAQASARLEEMMAKGTGCVEIKSGYGLSTESELKMLRVIKRLRENYPIAIKSTFLGAHAVGRAYAGRQSEYVDLVCEEMIPAVAKEKLAEFVDVFCDKGFFTVEETDRILKAGAKHGMRPKIHANELAVSGGVQVGVANGALSVDHLERIGEEEIEVLSCHDTVATMLPGASFFLNMPYGPAKTAMSRGVIVALASDYNPGSSPSGDMRFVMTLGCVKMRLTPDEAFNAATINGAHAMGCAHEYGSIAPGKIANFFITKKLSSFPFFTYAYTTPLIKRVFLRGREWS